MWKGNGLGKITILLEAAMYKIPWSEYSANKIEWNEVALRNGGLKVCDDNTGKAVFVVNRTTI
ncbi:hypothetical protein [Lentilactobacillus senioris]|uniref:hypothetical protein n=1 Tax=Lentilactobacillus senioris TaxID=931534 RepID=UPI003D2D3894